MYKTILPLLLVLILFACEPFKSGKSYITIKGRLTNSIDSFVLLKENYLKFKSHKTYIDKQGNFKFHLNKEIAQYYILQVDNQALDLFLYPGDKLWVDGDAGDFRNTVQYKGSSSYINNYLQKKDKYWSAAPLNVDSIFRLEPIDFKNYTENLYDQQISWIKENLTNDRERIQNFAQLELQGHYYSKAIWSMVYPGLYYELTTKHPENDLNNRVLEYKENLEREELLVSEKYNSFLHLFIESEIDSLLKRSDVKVTEQLRTRYWFQVVERSFENSNVKNKMFFDGIINLLRKDPFNSSELFSEFLNCCKDEKQIKIASEEFEAYKKLNPGMEAPLFAFHDQHGKQYNLSDFKGHNLYIDVWASWCTPCLNEYRILKSSKLMESDSVKVLSISVDDNPKKWKQMCQRQGMKGDQFIVPGGWNSELIKSYRINSVPNFISIDKQGRVIDVRAPKPSEFINNAELLKF